jgi:SAM-dependent methyltransferase
MYLPDQNVLTPIDADDPLPYYFSPLMGPIYRARLSAALALLDDGRGEACLEIGYGSGILLPELKRRFPRLAAIDFHRRGDAVQAMLRHEGLTVPLITGDICALPLASASYRTAVCLSVLEHLGPEQLEAAAGELARILRPGGVVVAGFPVRNAATDTFFRAVGYAPRDLHPSSHKDIASALGAHLRLESWRTVPRGLPRAVASYWVCRARRPA